MVKLFMRKDVVIGLFCMVFSLLGVIFVLAGDSQTPVSHWPLEAFEGLVFSLAWGLGLSDLNAIVLSLMLINLFAFIAFVVGRQLSRKL